jgi:hypothetical protein
MKSVDRDAAGVLPQPPDQPSSHEASTDSEPSKDRQPVTATGRRKVQVPKTLEREYWLSKKTSGANASPDDNKLK